MPLYVDGVPGGQIALGHFAYRFAAGVGSSVTISHPLAKVPAVSFLRDGTRTPAELAYSVGADLPYDVTFPEGIPGPGTVYLN